MRFVCDSCRAQYMISDEKVGAKGVKVRCKKCGYVILVRRPQDVAASAPAPTDDGVDATQVMQNPLTSAPSNPDPDVTAPGVSNPAGNGVLAGIADDEIGAVFDQVLNSGQHKIPADGKTNEIPQSGAALGESPDDRMSTRVLDAEIVQKLAAEAAQTGGAPASNGVNGTHSNGAKNGAASADHDWFVAIDEKQVGPLRVEKIKEHWDKGEIGPDSLCWRAGFSDWTPLSEVQELAAHLAPQPKKPVIVGSAPEPSLGAVVTVPVESAFSAGGVTRTVRSEVPVVTSAPSMAASSSTTEDVGWKPSAASALASLVKEEIEALAKPAPAPKKAEPAPVADRDGDAKVKGILEIPSEVNPVPFDEGATVQVPSNAGPPFSAAPSTPRPAPAAAAAPAFTPAPFGAAPYTTTYRAPKQTNKALVIGGSVVVVLLLVTLGLVGYLLVRDEGRPEQVAATTPPAVQQPMAVAQNTQPMQAQPAAPAQPQTPPANTQLASATAESKDAVQPAGSGTSAASETAALAKKEETPKAEASPAVAKREDPPARTTERRDPPPTRVAKADPPPKREERTVREEPPPAPKEEKKSSAPAPDADDDFDAVFGGSSEKKKAETPKATDDKKGKSSVYIPPAPGSADIPDKLGQSDIMQVVLANKPAIVKCVNEQKKQDPDLSGKLVMRWIIKTNGRTSNVAVQTAQFKNTYMATCIGGLIKSWKFPEHKTQGEPIDFPFTF